MKRFTLAWMTFGMVMAPLAEAADATYRVTEVLPEEFMQISKEKGAIILDVRDETDPKDRMMEGAVALPVATMTKEKMAAVAPNQAAPVLIFCNFSIMPEAYAKPSRMMSAIALAPRKLSMFGYQNIYVLKSGSVTAKGFSALPLTAAKKEQN